MGSVLHTLAQLSFEPSHIYQTDDKYGFGDIKLRSDVAPT
jgi:hypothetical protein